MTVGRRLLSDTIVYGLAYAASRGLSFALLPILTRAFTPADFGLFDLSMSLNRALLVLVVRGMDTGFALLLQGRDDHAQRSAVSSYLLAELFWSGAVAIAAGLAAPLLALPLLGDSSRWNLVLLAAALAVTQVLTHSTLNIAKWKREPGTYLVIAIGSTGFASALSVALVLGFDQRVDGALLGLVIGTALFIPFGVLLCLRHMGRRVSVVDMMSCVRLGLPFMAVASSEFLFPLLVRVTIFNTARIAAVGIFGAASTICLAVMLINEGFASAWWPYALSDEGVRRIQDDTIRVMRLYAGALMLLVVALTLAAEPLVILLLGGAFRQAAALVGPLALAYWIKSVRQNATVALIAGGRTWMRAALNFVALGAALACAATATVEWGLQGAAWGFAAGEGAGLAFQTAVVRRAYGHRIDVRATTIMTVAFIALVPASDAVTGTSTATTLALRASLGVAFVHALLALRAVRLGDLPR
jgi:O-antigen/teichoic acid export membrane protein